MENSHFIHRVHNAGNYVLDPNYEVQEPFTGPSYEEVLEQLKSKLNNNVEEWWLEKGPNNTDWYIVYVNGKKILTYWYDLDGINRCLVAYVQKGIITQIDEIGQSRVQSISSDVYYNTSARYYGGFQFLVGARMPEIDVSDPTIPDGK